MERMPIKFQSMENNVETFMFSSCIHFSNITVSSLVVVFVCCHFLSFQWRVFQTWNWHSIQNGSRPWLRLPAASGFFMPSCENPFPCQVCKTRWALLFSALTLRSSRLLSKKVGAAAAAAPPQLSALLLRRVRSQQRSEIPLKRSSVWTSNCNKLHLKESASWQTTTGATSKEGPVSLQLEFNTKAAKTSAQPKPLILVQTLIHHLERRAENHKDRFEHQQEKSIKLFWFLHQSEWMNPLTT